MSKQFDLFLWKRNVPSSAFKGGSLYVALRRNYELPPEAELRTCIRVGRENDFALPVGA